jgi:hypothetical protein
MNGAMNTCNDSKCPYYDLVNGEWTCTMPEENCWLHKLDSEVE